jgi:hypothetical protein
VAKISFDASANEAYLADGYLNKRVAVLDMDTGRIKRFWGAYGNVPSDSNYGGYDPDAPLIPQFRTPVHCADPSNDGLVYVCDRVNDRIQVFRRARSGMPSAIMRRNPCSFRRCRSAVIDCSSNR